MPSNNPIFNRSEEFNPNLKTANATGAKAAGGQPQYSAPATDPSTWGVGNATTTEPAVGERMTIDSVVQRTAISLAIVIATAFATWAWAGDVIAPNGLVDSDAMSKVYAAVTIGSLGAFALSMVNSFKRVISPALVLVFCAFEGVALGALSKMFDARFDDGVVSGAVVGTFAAFAGTLAAYKFFNISLGTKSRKLIMGAVLGMVALSVLELVLSLFGASLGLFAVSGIGMVTAFLGLILGVFMLIMDFEFVEYGVRVGLPVSESWRAAFAMTVSLVWIYTNLLRILAFFNRS